MGADRMVIGECQASPERADEMMGVRIVVADKRTEVRSALRLLLEQDGLTVVSEVATAAELLESAGRLSPDVVLVDCDLPGVHVTGFLLQVRHACPGVRVVALCSRPEMRLEALTAGADAFLCKTEPPETLVDLIREWFGPGERAGGPGQ